MSVRTGESQIKWYVQLIQPRHRNKTCTCSTATEVMVLRCVIGCSQKIEPGDQVTRRLFVSLCWVDHPLTALRVSGGQSVYKLDLRRSVTGFTCRLLLTQKDWACMQFSLVRWQVFSPCFHVHYIKYDNEFSATTAALISLSGASVTKALTATDSQSALRNCICGMSGHYSWRVPAYGILCSYVVRYMLECLETSELIGWRR